jgi:aryl-alcohol dehydrogenase-like predicted oxidoreductase
VLTGKYDVDPHTGRAAGTLDQARVAPAAAAGRELATLAQSTGLDPGTLAIAFALDNPAVASVLFGASRPDQIERNVGAIDVAAGLDVTLRERLHAIGR